MIVLLDPRVAALRSTQHVEQSNKFRVFSRVRTPEDLPVEMQCEDRSCDAL